MEAVAGKGNEIVKTRFTEQFGIERPIVMGGMMGVGRARLVAAVAVYGYTAALRETVGHGGQRVWILRQLRR